MRYTNPLYTPFLNPLSNELYRQKKKYEKGTSAERVVSSYFTSRQDTEGQGTYFNCLKNVELVSVTEYTWKYVINLQAHASLFSVFWAAMVIHRRKWSMIDSWSSIKTSAEPV